MTDTEREAVERELKYLLRRFIAEEGDLGSDAKSDDGEDFVEAFEKWVSDRDAVLHQRAIKVRGDPEKDEEIDCPYMGVVMDHVNDCEVFTDDEDAATSVVEKE